MQNDGSKFTHCSTEGAASGFAATLKCRSRMGNGRKRRDCKLKAAGANRGIAWGQQEAWTHRLLSANGLQMFCRWKGTFHHRTFLVIRLTRSASQERQSSTLDQSVPGHLPVHFWRLQRALLPLHSEQLETPGEDSGASG